MELFGLAKHFRCYQENKMNWMKIALCVVALAGTAQAQWIDRSVPSYAPNQHMLFDSWRAVSYLVDHDGDIWSYDYQGWKNLVGVSFPGSVETDFFVFDELRGVIVAPALPQQVVEEFDGQTWVQVDPIGANPPTGRLIGIVFDRWRELTLAFMETGDTWSYDGTQWLFFSTSPDVPPVGSISSDLERMSMTFDNQRGVVVGFGGRSSTTNQRLDETWEWDVVWARVFPQSVSPEPRLAAPFVFNDSTGTCFLMAGQGLTDSQTRDLWEYNGVVWTKVDSVPGSFTSPFTAGKLNVHMAYDQHSDRLVIHSNVAGGSGGVHVFEYGLERCPGDVNGDGVANITDLGIVLANFGCF